MVLQEGLDAQVASCHRTRALHTQYWLFFSGVLAIFNVKEQRLLEFILEGFWNCSSQMGLCKGNAIEWHGIFLLGFFCYFLFVCFHLLYWGFFY